MMEGTSLLSSSLIEAQFSDINKLESDLNNIVNISEQIDLEKYVPTSSSEIDFNDKPKGKNHKNKKQQEKKI